MSAQHSEEPWFADGEDDGTYTIRNARGFDVAYMVEAIDVPLVKAAPRLLAACQLALREKAEQYANTFDSRMDNDPVVQALRAAIKEATA